MRKFKALETIHGSITRGKIYEESESYTGNQGCIIIINDSGVRYALFEERFEEVPDTITFASQEDFENAVMAAVMKRLSIHSHEAYIQVGDFGSSV